MASRTQVALSAGEIESLIRDAFGAGARVAASRPLSGGTFNACWAVALADGAEHVLKVAPPPSLPLLRHERDLLRTEADFYARAAAAGVPVPAVLHADFGRRRIASDWLVMTKVPGASLHALRRRLAPAERDAVRRELGRATARLAAIEGERFGYPVAAVGTQASSWRAAFAAMLGILLDDADRYRVRLPRPRAAIEGLLEGALPALDAVATPRLVHFDLWDGNVFVERGPSGAGASARLAGILDGERAFWGDPLAELASLALFGEIENETALLAGWAEELGRAPRFAEEERTRIALAQLYLYLLMWIEMAPRGTGLPMRIAIRHLAGRSLRRAFGWLERAGGGGRR
jgi:aminoglycoside phosphotransferase (APT) family kinase protein